MKWLIVMFAFYSGMLMGMGLMIFAKVAAVAGGEEDDS